MRKNKEIGKRLSAVIAARDAKIAALTKEKEDAEAKLVELNSIGIEAASAEDYKRAAVQGLELQAVVSYAKDKIKYVQNNACIDSVELNSLLTDLRQNMISVNCNIANEAHKHAEALLELRNGYSDMWDEYTEILALFNNAAPGQNFSDPSISTDYLRELDWIADDLRKI